MRSDQAAPPAPARAGAAGRTSLRRALAHPRAPLVVLVLGSLIVALPAIDIALRVTGWAVDETIIKQSALHYRHGLPGTLVHDLNARATSRLFSLLLMPIFAIWDGDTGLRLARAFAAVCFCTTSVPVYLLARRVLRSQWFAVAAGLLAIAGPWLAISTTIYTENLAYPLFAWALLAMAWALERGGWRADAIVVGAIVLCTVTRVQLYALLPAWLVVVWATRWAGRSGGVRGFAERSWRAAPISHILLGIVVLIALFRLATGHLHTDLKQLLGAYSELQDRRHLSANTFIAVAHELQALTLTVFPVAVAALAWFAGTLRAGRRAAGQWPFAVLALGVTVVLWFISAYVQGGFLGAATEERYFFYVFPLLWIGAFAALEQPDVAGPRLVAAGIPLILLFATLGQPRPLDPQSTFLAPAAASVRNIFESLTSHVSGLTVTDTLAVISIVLLLLVTWVWRRHPRGRVAAVAVLAAVLELGVTGYTLAARDGHVAGVEGQTAGDVKLYAWIDRHSGGKDVTFLNNQAYQIDPPAEGWQYVTLLWNSDVTAWTQDPAAGLPTPVATIAALPAPAMQFDNASGAVHGLEGSHLFVTYSYSPFFQLAGKIVASGPGNDLNLLVPSAPLQAIWRAQGLQLDGSIDGDKPATFDAWVPPGSGTAGLKVEIDLKGAATGATKAELTLGKKTQEVDLEPGKTGTAVFTSCAKHLTGGAKPLQATTLEDGRKSAGQIEAVRVSADGSC